MILSSFFYSKMGAAQPNCFVQEKNPYQIDGTARIFWEENKQVHEGWLDITTNKIVKIYPTNAIIRGELIIIGNEIQKTVPLRSKLYESIAEVHALQNMNSRHQFEEHDWETLKRNFGVDLKRDIAKKLRQHEETVKFLSSIAVRLE